MRGTAIALTILSLIAPAPSGAPSKDDQVPEEIAIVLPPTLVKQVGESALVKTAQALLQQHFHLGPPLRRERNGVVVFSLPPGMSAADARMVGSSIERSGLAIAARAQPSLQHRREIETKLAFEKAASATEATGLIVKYRSASLVALSQANGVLPAAELARLSSLVDMPLISSRAMSGGAFVVSFAEPINLSRVLTAAHLLQNDPEIDYAVADELVMQQTFPNDPYFLQQWSLMAPPAGIDAARAWSITTGSPAGIIAIVDTGILGHPEFVSRIIGGYDFISDPVSAGDGNGRDPDPTDAGNWRTAGLCGPGSPAAQSEWHGTHVAGIIAAAGNNGMGIAGLDWNTKIVAARAIGKCGGIISDITDAMRWSAGLPVPGVPANPNPARVINMSLGGNTPCWLNPPEQDAILELLVTGVAVVVSAGNDDANATNYSPAGCFGVITVGATGPSGDRTSYSNYSNLALDISAPGGEDPRIGGAAGEIFSTWFTGTQSDPGTATYALLVGTSMAAPHVSGTVSLMLAANPDLTIAQIHDILRVTAHPFAPGSVCAQTGICGVGVLNAGDAVTLAKDLVGISWNFTDHWYDPAETGWGLQITAQGNLQFGTWYTYGADGYPAWFTMLLSRQGQDIFSGDVYVNIGTVFSAINGQPASTGATQVGSATMFYYDNRYGALVYTFNEQTVVKPLQRLEFASPLTFCQYDSGSRLGDTNYQDLWWNPTESGWGINLTHQGNTIFATWFTYADQGRPFWFYMVANQVAAN